ncbi:MAG: hypothetical protein GY849_02400 [Deltaproteobacteria bacterium]|nr:hypothetical protein [Deltaproteobacteria bacterium]
MPEKDFLKKLKRYANFFSFENFENLVLRLFENHKQDTEIIDIIQTRLYNFGVDSKDRKLRTDVSRLSRNISKVYADYTVKIKTKKQPRPDKVYSSWDSTVKNVTLNDYNDFYSSFKGILENKEFKLEADFWKDNLNTGKKSHIFENFKKMFTSKDNFEEVILDLTPKEKDIFLKIILLPDFLTLLKKEYNNIKD